MSRANLMRIAGLALIFLSAAMGLLGGFWSWLGRDQLGNMPTEASSSEGLQATLLFMAAWWPWALGAAVGIACGCLALRRA